MFPFGGWGGPEKDRVLWTNDACLDRLQSIGLPLPTTGLHPSSDLLVCLELQELFAELGNLLLDVKLANVVKNAQAAHTVAYRCDDFLLLLRLGIVVDTLVTTRQHYIRRFDEGQVELRLLHDVVNEASVGSIIKGQVAYLLVVYFLHMLNHRLATIFPDLAQVAGKRRLVFRQMAQIVVKDFVTSLVSTTPSADVPEGRVRLLVHFLHQHNRVGAPAAEHLVGALSTPTTVTLTRRLPLIAVVLGNLKNFRYR